MKGGERGQQTNCSGTRGKNLRVHAEWQENVKELKYDMPV